jgi:YD repeat-containing protein
MKNFTKSTILLLTILLLITSCKDNMLEDLEPLVGKKCLQKTYEKYENGKFIYKIISEYNSIDKLIKKSQIYPNSTSIILYEYDTNNNLIKSTDEKGVLITAFEYDSKNRLIKESQDENSSTSYITNYTYYDNGYLKKQTIVFANLIIWIREYDEKGQIVKRYDANFNGDFFENIPFKITRETETFYKYNPKGYVLSQFTTVDKKLLSSYEYEYDTDNRIIKYTEYDLNKTTTKNYSYLFDDKKRVISRKTDNVSEEKYEYNNDDLITKVNYFENNLLKYTETREYNSLRKITKSVFLDIKGNITSRSERTYYSNSYLKTAQYYSLKNGTGTELYKTSDLEYNPCGDVIKNVSFATDGSEQSKIIATYLYR